MLNLILCTVNMVVNMDPAGEHFSVEQLSASRKAGLLV
jgi:hypothetical protein